MRTLSPWLTKVIVVVWSAALIGLFWLGWPWIGPVLGWLTGQKPRDPQAAAAACNQGFETCRETCLARDSTGRLLVPPHRVRTCVKDCAWERNNCLRARQQ